MHLNTQVANENNGQIEAPTVLTLTRREAAVRLKIGLSTLDQLTKKGRIAVCRIGRRRLYTPRALEDYIARTETQKAA